MDNRAYLHEGELLLVSMRPSPAALIGGLLNGLAEALLAALAITLGFFGAGTIAGVQSPLAAVFPIAFLAVLAFVAYRRVQGWSNASFRVTSERILLQFPGSLFSRPLHTIKWTRYQESNLGKRSLADLLFRSRSLCVRYGTAGAELVICYPSLRHARDMKHYLDKVDSAVRRGTESDLRPFVAKPKGQRDAAPEEA